MTRGDDLNVLATDVQEGRAQDLAVADLPDFGVGHRDEVLRLDHVVGHARAGRELDVALDAVGSGQDGHFCLVRTHGVAPKLIRLPSDGYSNVCSGAVGQSLMKTFRYNVIVHWGDTDPAKIVFYP